MSPQYLFLPLAYCVKIQHLWWYSSVLSPMAQVTPPHLWQHSLCLNLPTDFGTTYAAIQMILFFFRYVPAHSSSTMPSSISAYFTTEWVQSKCVLVLDWAACSPDLGGNVWRIMKGKIQQTETSECWTTEQHSTCKTLNVSVPSFKMLNESC